MVHSGYVMTRLWWLLGGRTLRPNEKDPWDSGSVANRRQAKQDSCSLKVIRALVESSVATWVVVPKPHHEVLHRFVDPRNTFEHCTNNRYRGYRIRKHGMKGEQNRASRRKRGGAMPDRRGGTAFGPLHDDVQLAGTDRARACERVGRTHRLEFD